MSLAPEILQRLLAAHTVAVVGLSSDPARPSYGVARYLMQQGYVVYPVNPTETEVLGQRSWPDLAALVATHGAPDIVDVFRRPDFVPGIAEAAIGCGAGMLWLQEGVTHTEAEAGARRAGLAVVADRCILKEHRRARLQRG